MRNDSEPKFLLSLATWIEQWLTCLNFSLTKQTSHILSSLREVTNSEKCFKISSFVKENINFWEEDIFINDDLKETVLNI